MRKTWGIIGLGWLGQQLASKLKQKNCDTWGTHRNSFNFERDVLPQASCDVLFLNTPPLTQVNSTSFVEKVIQSSSEKIIFVSSTSVYNKNVGALTEDDLPSSDSQSGQWLLEVEKMLIEKLQDRVIIIRPGGLIGGGRHPVHFLSGRDGVANSDHSVNLIHRDDLIEIISLAANESGIQIINAVSPFHPRRDEYYNGWARKLKLKEVKFKPSEGPDRIVDSKHLSNFDWKCRSLDYS